MRQSLIESKGMFKAVSRIRWNIIRYFPLRRFEKR